MARVEIDFDGVTGTVKVNGKTVENVTRVSWSANAGDVPTVDIEVVSTEHHVTLDEADVTITPTVVALEKRL